jgi:hypothetical protein
MTFQEINNLRKQGKLEEAYRLAREALQNAPEDLWLNRATGWVLYDLIKRELQTVSESEGEAETTGEESSVDLQRVQRYFAEFRKLQLPLDETMIRSQMLRLAAKAQKAGWQGFLEFRGVVGTGTPVRGRLAASSDAGRARAAEHRAVHALRAGACPENAQPPR